VKPEDTGNPSLQQKGVSVLEDTGFYSSLLLVEHEAEVTFLIGDPLVNAKIGIDAKIHHGASLFHPQTSCLAASFSIICHAVTY
jgi:hypothetical protein